MPMHQWLLVELKVYHNLVVVVSDVDASVVVVSDVDPSVVV